MNEIRHLRVHQSESLSRKMSVTPPLVARTGSEGYPTRVMRNPTSGSRLSPAGTGQRFAVVPHRQLNNAQLRLNKAFGSECIRSGGQIVWCRFGVCLTLCLDLGSDACMKRVVERYAPQMYAPDAIFFSKHQITAQQIERDVHAIEAHSLCGAHSFLICSCSSCSRSLQYRYVFFVQVPGSATGSDNSDNVGPLGCAGRRRALQLQHV